MAAAGYLSEDILAEILKRLPIESVNRFKRVEKSWYHLIRSPYFKALYSDYLSSVYMLDSHRTQVLCIVTYGNIPLEDGCSADIRTNYVALSFFDIPGDFYTSKDKPLQKHSIDAFYRDDKAEDGGVVGRYFKARF